MSEPKETLTPQEISDLIEKKMRFISARTRASVAPAQVFQQQADVLVDMSGGTPPVSGTKYEWSTDGSVANAIGTQRNVRIYSIQAACTWTVQPTPLEIHITIDGNAIIHTKTDPVSAASYYGQNHSGNAPSNQLLAATQYYDRRGFVYEGRSIKIEAEITGGTVSALNARIKWAKIP